MTESQPLRGKSPDWIAQLPGPVKIVVSDTDTLAIYVLRGFPEGFDVRLYTIGDHGYIILRQSPDQE